MGGIIHNCGTSLDFLLRHCGANMPMDAGGGIFLYRLPCRCKQPLPIRAESQCINLAVVPGRNAGQHRWACTTDVPDLYLCVVVRHGKRFTIWAEGEATHRPGTSKSARGDCCNARLVSYTRIRVRCSPCSIEATRLAARLVAIWVRGARDMRDCSGALTR